MSIWNPDISRSEFRRASRFIWRRWVLHAPWQLLLVLWLAAGSLVIWRTVFLASDYENPYSRSGWITHSLEPLFPDPIIMHCFGSEIDEYASVLIDEEGSVRVEDFDFYDLSGNRPASGSTHYLVSGHFEYDSYGLWEPCVLVSRPAVTISLRRQGKSGYDLIDIPRGASQAQPIVTFVATRQRGVLGEVANAELNGNRKLSLDIEGIAHDSAMLVASFVFLSGFWFVPARFRATRRTRRAARGLCPGCTYDLTGLTAPICPECGQSIAPAPDTI